MQISLITSIVQRTQENEELTYEISNTIFSFKKVEI